MLFGASESLQAGKLDMNKPFRKPKNPIHNVNISGNSVITKHKKKNKKWKAMNNKPNPNNNSNPNNAAITMAPPHFSSNLNTRPVMMPMMSWMGHHNNANLHNNAHNLVFNQPEMSLMRNDAEMSSTSRKNVVKRRRIVARNKKNYYPNSSSLFHAPLAPRNTTSFIMRAKQQGGIASAVTPSPASLMQTPLLSPGFREKGSLEEMNKELGVDGYGSMNGLIRLRSSYEDRAAVQSETESDVEQGDNTAVVITNEKGGRGEDPTVHSVEQRIDQGLSRFEMIYPSSSPHTPSSSSKDGGMMAKRNIQNCVNGQERLIARLEEENLTLKERLFLVEQERNELLRRIREMEGPNHVDEALEEQFEESCGDVSTPCH